MKYLIFIFIILIFIIIIYNNTNSTDIIPNNYNIDSSGQLLSFINGYWISNDEFNNASDIDKMILYIDYFNNIAKLVIISNNKLIVNDEYQIYIDDDNINQLQLTNFKISFISKEKLIWANKQFKCILNINSGNIKLIDEYNKTVFGDLFKDNIISNFINSF
jgi:hypothetical protein